MLLHHRRSSVGGAGVKIQGESQVLDRSVIDADGRRLGRIIPVECTQDDSYWARVTH
jgi:hypothetical protein